MTLLALLTDLSARGVIVTVAGDAIELDAPADALTDDDVVALRESKPDIIRLLRLADGLPVDDDAAATLALDEVDPAGVPTCKSCGGLCDVQTLDDRWHCSHCDPLAEHRRRRTERLLRSAAAIRYTGNRNG
ncbi:hypothetical protein Enr13x_48530 [Stieleria neptunia]|uniref:TubC N-terminal docking domain-containing protein n=1 Tax=Stieleria neptunia TaxID=2527979 RepID=A0A518HVU9_9BACT|nr:hypothetical protein [Stieleria neptunia]QDV44980.1 hypothetical protein Enr13x_48530 [Stieleria neptunia]